MRALLAALIVLLASPVAAEEVTISWTHPDPDSVMGWIFFWGDSPSVSDGQTILQVTTPVEPPYPDNVPPGHTMWTETVEVGDLPAHVEALAFNDDGESPRSNRVLYDPKPPVAPTILSIRVKIDVRVGP